MSILKDLFSKKMFLVLQPIKRVKESPYHGVDNAYNIAYFYLNNRVTFPDSVEFAEQSIIGSFTGAYQDTRVPHRKTLYIVDHGQGSEHRVFSADFTKRGLRQRQGVVSPDVFLASMVNLRHTFPS